MKLSDMMIFKKHMQKSFQINRVEYTKGKTAFIVPITEKAKEYYHVPEK